MFDFNVFSENQQTEAKKVPDGATGDYRNMLPWGIICHPDVRGCISGNKYVCREHVQVGNKTCSGETGTRNRFAARFGR